MNLSYTADADVEMPTDFLQEVNAELSVFQQQPCLDLHNIKQHSTVNKFSWSQIQQCSVI